MNKRAYIIFTREPVPGKTKTRLMPYFTPEQCAALHCCFLKDFKEQTRRLDADVVVYYMSEDGKYELVKDAMGPECRYFEQKGDDLGTKMYNAIDEVLAMGYESCVLTGTDIPELTTESIQYAFDMLETCDAVVGPTVDGGYHLIGMKEPHVEPFRLDEYQSASVLENTINSMRDAGMHVELVHEYQDMDHPHDAAAYRKRMRDSKKLQESYTGKFLASTAKISVIIPIYNEEKLIESSMGQLRPYRNELEIIYVDGGSTDSTLALMGDEFNVIHADKGRATQLNAGAKAATGDILFFLHCDSTLPGDFISQIREVMTKHHYGCFGLDFDSHHFFMWTNKHISNHRAWRRGLPFGDQGIFIDRDLFMDMGMFPEMPLMEDYELAMRLKAAGYMPGKTRDRIMSSTRRYDGSITSVMKTEFQMWRLRIRYRRGEDVNKLAAEYKDVR